MKSAKTKPKQATTKGPAVQDTRRTKFQYDTLWLQGLFLVGLVVLSYLPVFGAGFIWDDDDYVTANQALRSTQGLFNIWFKLGTTPQYYPFVHTTFWLEYHTWALWAPGYHAVNLLLHAANCVLVWRILRHLEIPGAFLAAAIFAVHPVEVESVAWITERKNVLSGLFYLLALWSYLHADSLVSSDRRLHRRWYIGSLAAFAAAMFSKTVAFSLPAAVLLIEWWKTGRVSLKTLVRQAPFFALGIGLALVTLHVEKTHVGAQGKEWDLNFGQRILIAGRALWFYAGKLLCPVNLTFIYPKWNVSTSIWWQWVFPVGFIAILGALVSRVRVTGRGPLTTILFFAGTLFPALGFFNTYPMRYSYVADHFQYLASLGLITLACALATTYLPRYGNRAAMGFLTAAVVVTLGTLTFKQCLTYKDLETLWRDVLRKNDEAGIAHGNLANVLADHGDLANAMAHYNRAIALDPEDELAIYNKGVTLYHVDRAEEAIKCYDAAIKIRARYPEAHFNRGKAHEKLGRVSDAMQDYDRSIACSQNFSPPWAAKGALLASLDKPAEARAAYEQALKLSPNDQVVWFNLAEIYATIGEKEKASHAFEKCTQIDPRDAQAYARLGDMAEQLSRKDDALRRYREALKIDPKLQSAKDGLHRLGVDR